MAIKRRNKKTSSGPTLKRQQFLALLKKVHLNGAINECTVTIGSGIATVEVVDITNSIIVLHTPQMDTGVAVGSKAFSASFGLGNMEVLIKFLSTLGDDDVKVEVSDAGDRLVIASKNGRRKIDYLATLPDLISTRLRMDEDDDEDYIERFQSMVEVSIEMDQDLIKDLVSYLATPKSKVATIEVEKDQIRFVVGTSTEHRFEVTTKADCGETFSITTNAENLGKVLANVDFGDSALPTIGLSDSGPIVVEDGFCLWAIVPYEDEQ